MYQNRIGGKAGSSLSGEDTSADLASNPAVVERCPFSMRWRGYCLQRRRFFKYTFIGIGVIIDLTLPVSHGSYQLIVNLAMIE